MSRFNTTPTPSIKALLPLVSGDNARAILLRDVLLGRLLDRESRYHDTWHRTVDRVFRKQDAPDVDTLADMFPATYRWLCQCYNPPSLHDIEMSIADEIMGTFGVEYIEHGRNAKSPVIEYCNAGDTYATTLLYVNGRYRVGCWGDIVERGNYE